MLKAQGSKAGREDGSGGSHAAVLVFSVRDRGAFGGLISLLMPEKTLDSGFEHISLGSHEALGPE